MLANRERGDASPARSLRTQDPASLRREVLLALAAVGPHLLAASRAADGPRPLAALRHLRRAAAALTPYIVA